MAVSLWISGIGPNSSHCNLVEIIDCHHSTLAALALCIRDLQNVRDFRHIDFRHISVIRYETGFAGPLAIIPLNPVPSMYA